MHLLMVRHGQSFVNLPDWDDGFVDAGLTALGQQQAAAAAKWLAARVTVDALYTSTMARAQETAAFITQETGVQGARDHRLREFGNCYADGRPVPLDNGEVIAYPTDWWGTQRPNTRISAEGESWMTFRVRVSAFLSEVVVQHGSNGAEDAGKTVVVVCHGGVIEATFDHVFNIGEQRRTEIWVHNTGIVHLEYLPDSGREIWRLHAHAMVQHLVQADGSWLGASSHLRGADRSPASGGDD
ncbi:MAG: histidine phosphatase family protein [Anaerolineae bacterium]|nr:histidine phosphatase family protein [Anaerolineae bacterium]